MPPPVSVSTCSMKAPSVLAKVFSSRQETSAPWETRIPFTRRIASSASRSRPTFFSSGTTKGSIS